MNCGCMIEDHDIDNSACVLRDLHEGYMSSVKAVTEKVTCGCGDIRLRGEMCHLCGRCQMGCCQCETPNERIARIIPDVRQRCREFMRDNIKSSDHVFPQDERRGIPVGNCVKCGMPFSDVLANGWKP